MRKFILIYIIFLNIFAFAKDCNPSNQALCDRLDSVNQALIIQTQKLDNINSSILEQSNPLTEFEVSYGVFPTPEELGLTHSDYFFLLALSGLLSASLFSFLITR